MSSYTPASFPRYPAPLSEIPQSSTIEVKTHQTWLVFAASVFLVSVPVFIQAPLVRQYPLISLLVTLGWLGASLWLRRRPGTYLWGDLLLGFTWTWLTGAIYWGWLRWEPLLHLPIEALGLPFAVWGLLRQKHLIGNWFYLGSLFGTAMTDVYFYLVNLIPHWRQLMQVDPSFAGSILRNALVQMQTGWGVGAAVLLVAILLAVGSFPLRSRQLHWWAFGGAVLSTLLVDGLFWFAATLV